MLDILVIVLAVAGGLTLAFLAYVALKPDEFRVERSIDIQASSDAIFPLINDLRGFNSWNPWAKSDPQSAIVYTGPASGVGCAYDWNGKRSGTGRMEIVGSTPASKVTAQLHFKKPFAASNTAEFTIEPHNGASRVTWAMTGRRTFLHKLMGTLFGMDKMVGGMFARGLEDLKAIAETTT